MSDARSLGMVVGVLLDCVFAVMIFKFANRNGKAATKYDERQSVLRGRGYMYGFYAVLICEALMVTLSSMRWEIPVEREVLHFLIIIVGIFVQVSYCVWKDAYWGLNNDKRRYTIVFLAIGILNLITSLRSFMDGSMLTDGKLQASFLPLLCSVVLILLGLELAIKELVDKQKEGD